MKLGLIKDKWRRRQLLRQDWQQVPWLALDLETNGLDPAQDAILAAGWVPLKPPRIRLFEADYGVVKSTTLLSQSAVIHQLSSKDIAAGESLERILKRLARQLEDAILVAHHAPFDWQFLQKAFAEYGIKANPLAVFDTLKFEQRRLKRQKDWLEKGELTLAACRERYHLVKTKQHHALSDAVACAELFLAQVYQATGTQRTSAAQLLQLTK